MGEDVGKWERLLQDMKRSRSTFDNTDSKHSFGPILVDYAEVQVCECRSSRISHVCMSQGCCGDCRLSICNYHHL